MLPQPPLQIVHIVRRVLCHFYVVVVVVGGGGGGGGRMRFFNALLV